MSALPLTSSGWRALADRMQARAEAVDDQRLARNYVRAGLRAFRVSLALREIERPFSVIRFLQEGGR